PGRKLPTKKREEPSFECLLSSPHTDTGFSWSPWSRATLGFVSKGSRCKAAVFEPIGAHHDLLPGLENTELSVSDRGLSDYLAPTAEERVIVVRREALSGGRQGQWTSGRGERLENHSDWRQCCGYIRWGRVPGP